MLIMDKPTAAPVNKTRITFDFDGEWRESIEKLSCIICSSHWARWKHHTLRGAEKASRQLSRRRGDGALCTETGEVQNK
jgi:hypothetical protein